VLLGISIPLVFGENFVYERDSEVITLESAKSVYTDNDVIYISGSVYSVDAPSVLIGIYDPFGMPTGFYFGNIDSNNEFSISFLAKAGINFKIEGKYDAIAYYSDSKKIVYFDFVESLDYEIFETETIGEPIPNETIEEPIPNETIEDNLIIIKESQIKADIQEDVLQETPQTIYQ
jgi:hypothetical protein